MQTNYLKYFVDVAELGSISEAAALNFISPQGLSRALSVLEKELGCQLFRRTSNRSALTDCGKLLLGDAYEVLKLVGDMANQVTEMHAREDGFSEKAATLYFSSGAFDTALIGPLMDSAERLFSEARFVQCDNEDVFHSMVQTKDVQDRVSIGFLSLISVEPENNEDLLEKFRNEGFVYRPYLRTYDKVLVSKRSDLANYRSLSKADILSFPIASAGGDIHRALEKLFGRESICLVTRDSNIRFRAVSNNKAITFVPAFYECTMEKMDDVVAVPMRDPYQIEFGFVGSSEILSNPIIKRMVDTLDACFKRFASAPACALVSDLYPQSIGSGVRLGFENE